jgi:hypothetical protein
MNRFVRGLALIALVSLLASASKAQTQPDEPEATWRVLKSADGRTKSKPVIVKFQPTTRNWRLKVNTQIRGEPTASRIRVAVLVETVRDVDDKPVNWAQTAILLDGKPGQSAEKEFDDGLDKSAQPKWFQVVITGHNATYDVVIEDQAPIKPRKSKKKKSDG